MTAFQALLKAKVGPGDQVLVLGGSGGTGSMGVQIAKSFFGCQVTATGRTENVEWVKNLGASQVIDYKKRKWEQELKVGFTRFFDRLRGGIIMQFLIRLAGIGTKPKKFSVRPDIT